MIRLLIISAVLCIAIQPAVAEESIELAKQKSATCMACHGINGVSNNDLWPNLAGQKRGYLVSTIKAYRDGKREDIMMTPLVKKLTDDDIALIARDYSEMNSAAKAE